MSLTQTKGSLAPCLYRIPFYGIDMQEIWFFTTLTRRPELPPHHCIPSTSHTRPAEAETNPALKEVTYDFAHTKKREDVGPQILTAAGWRPDSAISDTENVTRALPPKGLKGPPHYTIPHAWG